MFERWSGTFYSIAKYFTLRALGVPKENMRVVVLMETIRNLPHAALVVYLGDDAYVLDNLHARGVAGFHEL